MQDAARQHWPEYLMEAAGLALFMISASLFASLLEHPASPVRQAIPSSLLRRALMALAMGWRRRPERAAAASFRWLGRYCSN